MGRRYREQQRSPEIGPNVTWDWGGNNTDPGPVLKLNPGPTRRIQVNQGQERSDQAGQARRLARRPCRP